MSEKKQASLLVQGYEVVIGFETHAQLATKSKIFSRAPTACSKPRTSTCAHRSENHSCQRTPRKRFSTKLC